MSVIKTIEDALIDKIKATLADGDGKSLLRVVDWAPPDWDVDFIKRVIRAMPGAFVVFEGGQKDRDKEQTTLLNTRWSIVAVSGASRSAKERARGEPNFIGCYDMLEALAPVLDGMDVANVGTLSLVSWNNEDAYSLDDEAMMVQSLSFELPVELVHVLAPSALVPFEIYHDTFNVGQLPGAPVTEDNVELEQ